MMVDLAKSNVTMIVVTHEMGFGAKEVGDQMHLFDEGHLRKRHHQKNSSRIQSMRGPNCS